VAAQKAKRLFRTAGKGDPTCRGWVGGASVQPLTAKCQVERLSQNASEPSCHWLQARHDAAGLCCQPDPRDRAGSSETIRAAA
jgi:hypothetical protein